MKHMLPIPLGELLLPTEQRDPRDRPNDAFTYIDISSIDNTIKTISGAKRVLGADAPSRARKIVRSGDVIVSTVRPNLNAVALVSDTYDGQICSTGFSVLRPSQCLLSGYLFAFVRSASFVKYLEARTTGANYPAVNDNQVRAAPIMVPPLAEQERIVKLLDEVDELRKLRGQADRRAAELLASLFHASIGKFDVPEKSIGKLLEDRWLLLHKDGNHGSLYPRASDFGTDGIPFLSATAVTDQGTIDHSEVKRLRDSKASLLRHGWIERGDVLLAHNATVGRVGYYEGEYDRAIIGTSLTAFRANPKYLDARYLWASLRSEFFQRQLERVMKQALRNQVPITAQRELLLQIPPLAMQTELATHVTDIIELERLQADTHGNLNNLVNSMLYSAFAGEL